MKIQVHGKQVDLGDALRGHATDRIAETVSRYSARPVEAVVTFSRDRHLFACDVLVHLSTGLNTQGKAQATDIYESFDAALGRIETQLRRYKRRLKNHHNARPGQIERFAAPAYVLRGDQEETESDDALSPVIIAESETTIPSLSVGEAVMQMELSHAELLVFRNESLGRINVVHRRTDGNIGWIDPAGAR
jgi:ribosomal subunit interface protein